MANVIGNFTDELEEGVKEVVTEVKDAVGEAIEENAQTAMGTTLTPQQIQQQQINDQKATAEVRRKLQYHQATKADLDKEIQANKQKEAQRRQDQQQEEQQKQMRKIENKKASPPKPGAPMEESMEAEEVARTRQESGKGHGIGS